MYKCPRHPWAYCIDEDGETCVLCEQFHKRKEMEIQKENRLIQEANVAAALASRAGTCKTGKAEWGNKLPTAGKLARTAANKAREDSKATNIGGCQKRKGEKAWKGAKGAELPNHAATPNFKDVQAPNVEQDKAKGKPKLRIQRGR